MSSGTAPSSSLWIDAIEEQSNLTRSQFLIWMGQQLAPSSSLYNMVFAFRLRGPLDRQRWREAHERMCEECEALRTVVRLAHGVPQQEVLDTSPITLECIDLRDGAREECGEWVEAHARTPLVLGEALGESALLRTAEHEHVWFLKLHHLITDGWSTALLCERLAAHYDGAPDMESLPSYQSYRARERGARGSSSAQRGASYFETQWREPVEPLHFYGNPTRSASTARTRRLRVPLGEARSAALTALAASPGARLLNDELSLFRVMMTVVCALLARLHGARRLCVGVPMHNRLRPVDKRTPGLFMEVFPLTVDVAADDSVVTLLEKVGQAIVDTMRHGQPGLSRPEGNKAYEVLLNFVPVRMAGLTGMDVSTDWVHAGAGDAAHKLRIQVHDFDGTGDLTVDLDGNESTFSPAAHALLARHFMRVVDTLLERPEQRIMDVPLLDAGECEDRRTGFNHTQRRWEVEPNLIDDFLRQASRTPHAVALRGTASPTLTYAELRARVEGLAVQLRKDGVGPGAVVALLMPRSADALVAMLATLRAGGAYLPLDVRHPKARLAQVLADVADSSLHLAGVFVPAALDSLVPSAYRVLSPRAPSADDVILGPAVVDGLVAPGNDDLAYLIYTSGSTGAPKGVRISHGALANYLRWACDQYCAGEARDFALHTSLAVDLTVTSLFVPLLCGGAVVVYEDQTESDLPVLRVFEEDDVDIVKLTPAHLELVRELGTEVERVRTLVLGGEDLKSDLVQAVASQFPPTLALYNEYGPTEATVGCMVHRYDAPTESGSSVRIGAPIANTRIHLLERDGDAPVPTGLVGEICVAGAGLASGYVERPELDRERFVYIEALGERVYRTGDLGRWEPEGELSYLGRGDAQVKIRGARIELADVEGAALIHPGVTQAVAEVIHRKAQKPVRHCRRCALPSNYPGVVFDASDLCSMCATFERHAQEAQAYFQPREALEAIAERMRTERRGAYDCIVLLSGGKDSTYMIYQVVALGLKVLAITLDNGFISEGAMANVRHVVEALGVEHVMARTPHMNEIFADSLRRHSNVCHGCFKTIYTLAVQEALARDVDYIVTGLSRGQIFETRLDAMFHQRQFDVPTVERAIVDARKVYHRIDDAVARTLDVRALQEGDALERVQFVDFYRYWDVPLDEVYSFLKAQTPWQRPPDTGRSTNCLINEAGIYVHRKERGYHNYALPYSWDVRLGHKTRAAALHELDDDIDRRRVRDILQQVGYAEPPARDQAALALYYVSGAEAVPVDVLRATLVERLPDELLPTYLIPLDAFPLASTGKVDRKALPRPAELQLTGRQRPYVAPRTDVEQRLAEVWCELLDVPKVGIDDDFFTLGGASLTAIQSLSRIREAFEVTLPLQTFFAAPSLGAVAQAIEAALIAEIESLSDAEVERLLSEG